MFTGERDMTQHDTTSMAPCGREPTQKVAEQGRDSKSSNWLFQGTGSYQNFRTCARRGVQAEQQQRRATGAADRLRLVQLVSLKSHPTTTPAPPEGYQPGTCARCGALAGAATGHENM